MRKITFECLCLNTFTIKTDSNCDTYRCPICGLPIDEENIIEEEEE